ncbi:MAG: hypothetical protein EOO04_25935, partial [Chitinophagaceae bacterium]
MKTLKNLSFGILAIVLGLGLVVTQSAFKATATETLYQYNENSSSDVLVKDYLNWEPVISGDPGCGQERD